MGFIRLLHAPIPRFTMPYRVETSCMQEVAYGHNAIEAYEPDMYETEDITLWWGLLIYFDDAQYTPIVVNALKSCRISVNNVVYALEDLLGLGTRKGLTIIVAPDQAITDALLFNDYEALARHIVIFVEEELPSLEQVAAHCPLCEGEEDYQWCVERCIEQGIVRVEPRILNIYAKVYGHEYQGCNAYRIVGDWLPEKEQAHFRRVCG